MYFFLISFNIYIYIFVGETNDAQRGTRLTLNLGANRWKKTKQLNEEIGFKKVTNYVYVLFDYKVEALAS